MLKSEMLIGKPISIYNTLAVIGTIHAIVFDHQRHHTAAFVLSAGEISDETRILPWMGIHHVSEGGVFALSERMIVRAGDMFTIKNLLKSEDVHAPYRFTDWKGNIQTATSTYFDPRTGMITGYEMCPSADQEAVYVPLSEMLPTEHVI